MALSNRQTHSAVPILARAIRPKPESGSRMVRDWLETAEEQRRLATAAIVSSISWLLSVVCHLMLMIVLALLVPAGENAWLAAMIDASSKRLATEGVDARLAVVVESLQQDPVKSEVAIVLAAAIAFADDDFAPAESAILKRLANGVATPEEREFIKRKVNAAQWLIESIEQRRSTLTDNATMRCSSRRKCGRWPSGSVSTMW